MTERQCPLCHIHAIQSPHGQCANANCPPFEEWPTSAIVGAFYGELAQIVGPVIREAEPSPAPLVEVETVDGTIRPASLLDLEPAPTAPPIGDMGTHDLGVAIDSRPLLPKVELTMPAPQPIRTLGETLGNILKAATERADKLAQKVQTSSDELHKVMDATEEVSQDMDRVTADMKTKLGLGGNGGPAL